MALVNGFAGLRDTDGGDLRFAPRLPPDWNGMRFRLICRGSRMEVEMRPDETTYRLLDGAPLSLISDGQRFTIAQGEPMTVPVAADADDLPAAAAAG